jgi:hypothetical protein
VTGFNLPAVLVPVMIFAIAVALKSPGAHLIGVGGRVLGSIKDYLTPI